MRTVFFAVVVCSIASVGYYLAPTSAADPTSPVPVPAAERLVVHEWGTFTSFSGSNGVPVGFTPNNTDLPNFVYFQGNPNSKAGRLYQNGLVSMETPVVYFYADREMKVSLKVDFARGWITEWFPFAAAAPSTRAVRSEKTGGQSIRWDARLLPGEPVQFPRDRNEDRNPYFHARHTDSVPVQTEVPPADERREYELRGGSIVQREKFLFYRGVGTFPPPVAVKAIGGDKVRITNGSGGKIVALALVSVRNKKVGFRPVEELASGGEMLAVIPEANTNETDVAQYLVKALTAAGLYEKEAKAMVNTWSDAWFGEEGTRLLYLVPRAKTDELLPVTISPKPTEIVRVLVGRHDFLTPEQEAIADQQLKRLNAAQAELNAAQQALAKLGRFSLEARQLAAKRLEAANGTGQPR